MDAFGGFSMSCYVRFSYGTQVPGKFYFSFASQIFAGSACEPCRWLIDLEGLRDVDICNAYADAQSTSYPGGKSLEIG